MPAGSWAEELVSLVDLAVSPSEPEPELVAACTEHARRCEVGHDEDVVVAFDEMFRLADHAGAHGDGRLAEQALATSAQLAVDSYAVTGDPGFVVNLARFLAPVGAARLALDMVRRALSITAGSDGPAAVLQLKEGQLSLELGDLDRAELAFRAALAVLGPPPGEDEARSAVLNELGRVRHTRGDLDEARDLLVASLDAAERAGAEPLGLAITLDNLGLVECDLARRAGPVHLVSEDGGDLVNMAADDHLRQAEELFDRAHGLFDAALPDAIDDYVISLVNRAEPAWQRGDRHALDSTSRRALGLVDGHPVRVDTAWSAVALRGRVLEASGEPRAACELLLPRFEALVDLMGPRRAVSEGYTTVLRAAATVGDEELLLHAAGCIVAVDDAVLTRQLAGGSHAEARHAFLHCGARAEMIVGHCLPPDREGIAPTWLYELVLNRKGVLAERQGSAWLRARHAEGASQDLVDRLRAARAELARLDLEGGTTESIRRARRDYRDAEREVGRLEAELHREVGAARQPVSLDDVRAALGPDTLLVDITKAIAPDETHRYVAFLVAPEGPVRYRVLGPVDHLDADLGLLVGLLATPPPAGHDGDDTTLDATPLGPALVGPADPLPGHLVVSPTGRWGGVPPALLPGRDGRRLIDDHDVSLVPSARWLATHARAARDRDERPGPPAGPPVVIGDPDFDLRYFDHVAFFLRERVDRLVHAAAETAQVARLLGVAPTVRRDATRQHLVGVERPRVLHAATHGVFLDAIGGIEERREPTGHRLRAVAGVVVREDGDGLGFTRPGGTPTDARAVHDRRREWLADIGPAGQLTRSALLFTGFNAWLAGVTTPPDAGTGILTAGEVAELDLASTELVVLSACQTGVGAIDYADGTNLGLRSAALIAGASCCVSSLWSVDDDATATLMTTFYERLAAGDGTATALRSAQLVVRSRLPHPYYWAAWVAEGHTGPVTLATPATPATT